MFFLREGGVRLGLVVEGVGGRLGLVLVMICLRLNIPFSTGVSSQTGKKQALLIVCESLFSFFFEKRECAQDLLFEGEGDGKGRAPVDQGVPKKSGIIGNLLIQHTVSRRCSSGCVHEGCGGVNHCLQTKDHALLDFLLQSPQQAGQYNMPRSCAETAELLDAVFSTVS